jgi:hypothetical protein
VLVSLLDKSQSHAVRLPSVSGLIYQDTGRLSHQSRLLDRLFIDLLVVQDVDHELVDIGGYINPVFRVVDALGKAGTLFLGGLCECRANDGLQVFPFHQLR